MKVIILTLYPEMFPGPLGHSLPGKALADGIWAYETIHIRDFATDKHRTVDDTPYGGGAGMVMKPDVVAAAIDAAKAKLPDARVIHFTPRGQVLTQGMIKEIFTLPSREGHISPSFILLCGRFEGIDQRVIDHYQMLEISIGDYVLFGGELASMVFLEAALRHIPGMVGNPETLDEESFSIGKESALLLEYPQYTKPPSWRGHDVPEVLTSGHHERISTWRRNQAEAVTKERRPDLWIKYKDSQGGKS
ncbi:MAG: tRNA (guanosine(37)-N1)-methyltransferase TrmD [Rickettsiales bacterium]